MPSQTPQKTQEQIVALRKAGKTYSQIQRETGAAGPTVAKVLKKAGLTGKGSSVGATSGLPAPIQTATLTPTPKVLATTAEATPQNATGSAWLNDFQPPAPPEPRKAVVYQTDCCRAMFSLDPGETLDSVKVCPAGCGGVP